MKMPFILSLFLHVFLAATATLLVAPQLQQRAVVMPKGNWVITDGGRPSPYRGGSERGANQDRVIAREENHQTDFGQLARSNEKATERGTSVAVSEAKTDAVIRQYAERLTLSNQRPEYPIAARRHRQEGRVRLRAWVQPKQTSQARLEKLSVEESSGYPLLDEASVKAVQGWTFPPFPVPTDKPISIVIPLEFSLSRQ